MIHHLIGIVPFMATILLSTIALSLSSDAQAQLERVTLGYPATAMSHFPAFVGREFGQFREEGLDVQLVRVTGNVVVAALLADELATRLPPTPPYGLPFSACRSRCLRRSG